MSYRSAKLDIPSNEGNTETAKFPKKWNKPSTAAHIYTNDHGNTAAENEYITKQQHQLKKDTLNKQHRSRTEIHRSRHQPAARRTLEMTQRRTSCPAASAGPTAM